MATEKTPALMFANKAPFENEEKTAKICSRAMITWILAITLITVVLILSVEFLYPTFEEKLQFDENRLRILEDRPLEVTVAFHKSTTSGDKKRTSFNPWDFDFLIDPADLCQTHYPPTSRKYQQNPEVKLLMLVPSAVDHFAQRKAIRNTWGSVAENSPSSRTLGPFRLGFVIGTSANKTIGDLVRKESAEFKDVIQVDLVDNHFGQTTKSVLMLKWVAKRCPHAQYFLKSDDDTFVNVGIVADILHSEPFLSTKKFIGGYVYNGLLDSNIPKEELYAIENNLPFDQFPAFTSGSAYVMTGPTAVDLFDASKEVQPVLPMEDVFLTGICADHMGIPRLHDTRFSVGNPPSPPTWDSFSSLASVHRVTPNILEEVWNDLTKTVLSQLFNAEARLNSAVLLRKKRNL